MKTALLAGGLTVSAGAAYWVGLKSRDILDRWRLYSGRLSSELVLDQVRTVDGVTWEIVARPEGKNDNSKNDSGMLILLKHSGPGSMGSREEEIGAVGFVRENSLHPDVEFGDQLDIEIEKAQKMVTVLSDLTAGAGQLA